MNIGNHKLAVLTSGLILAAIIAFAPGAYKKNGSIAVANSKNLVNNSSQIYQATLNQLAKSAHILYAKNPGLTLTISITAILLFAAVFKVASVSQPEGTIKPKTWFYAGITYVFIIVLALLFLKAGAQVAQGWFF
jgi:hypothetical protein